MGTRALIGYLDTDQTPVKLTATYNHYDGYPENLGVGLEKFYNSDAKAEEISNIGYISYLDPETGEWDAKNKSNPDVVTLPDNFNEAMEEIAYEIDKMGADYGYIWDNENEEWITVTNRGIRKMAESLEMNLAHLKEKFAMMPERPDQTMEEGMSRDEEDVLGDWISDMLKYKSYDEVVKTVKRALRDALMDDELVAKIKADKEEKELDEIFVRQMKYKAGIIK